MKGPSTLKRPPVNDIATGVVTTPSKPVSKPIVVKKIAATKMNNDDGGWGDDNW